MDLGGGTSYSDRWDFGHQYVFISHFWGPISLAEFRTTPSYSRFFGCRVFKGWIALGTWHPRIFSKRRRTPSLFQPHRLSAQRGRSLSRQVPTTSSFRHPSTSPLPTSRIPSRIVSSPAEPTAIPSPQSMPPSRAISPPPSNSPSGLSPLFEARRRLGLPPLPPMYPSYQLAQSLVISMDWD